MRPRPTTFTVLGRLSLRKNPRARRWPGRAWRLGFPLWGGYHRSLHPTPVPRMGEAVARLLAMAEAEDRELLELREFLKLPPGAKAPGGRSPNPIAWPVTPDRPTLRVPGHLGRRRVMDLERPAGHRRWERESLRWHRSRRLGHGLRRRPRLSHLGQPALWFRPPVSRHRGFLDFASSAAVAPLGRRLSSIGGCFPMELESRLMSQARLGASFLSFEARRLGLHSLARRAYARLGWATKARSLESWSRAPETGGLVLCLSSGRRNVFGSVFSSVPGGRVFASGTIGLMKPTGRDARRDGGLARRLGGNLAARTGLLVFRPAAAGRNTRRPVRRWRTKGRRRKLPGTVLVSIRSRFNYRVRLLAKGFFSGLKFSQRLLRHVPSRPTWLPALWSGTSSGLGIRAILDLPGLFKLRAPATESTIPLRWSLEALGDRRRSHGLPLPSRTVGRKKRRHRKPRLRRRLYPG